MIVDLILCSWLQPEQRGDPRVNYEHRDKLVFTGSSAGGASFTRRKLMGLVLPAFMGGEVTSDVMASWGWGSTSHQERGCLTQMGRARRRALVVTDLCVILLELCNCICSIVVYIQW